MNASRLARGIVLITCMLSAWALQTHTLISGDITWLMHVGTQVLQGGHYYQDFIEVNAPMAIYIYLIPVLLSKLFNSNFITSVTYFTFVCSVLAWLSSRYLLHKLFNHANKTARYCFEIALAFTFLIVPAYAFGQREHLFIMLIMPYLLLRSLRLREQTLTPGLAIALGLGAGIGFSIKPFFLLHLLLIELYVGLKARKIAALFTLETLSCASIFIIYGCSVIWLTPQYLLQSLQLIQPLYYFNFSLPYAVCLQDPLLIFSLFVLVLYSRLRTTCAEPLLADVLAISVVSEDWIFLLQHTRWYYHYYPAFTFTILLATLLSASYWQCNNLFKIKQLELKLLKIIGVSFILTSVLSYAVFATLYKLKISFDLTHSLFKNPIYTYASAVAPQPIYIFTDNIAVNYPLIDYTGARNISAFPCLWLLGAAQKLTQSTDATPAQQNFAIKVARWVRTRDIDSLILHKPALIFVQLTTDCWISRKKIGFTILILNKPAPVFLILIFLREIHASRSSGRIIIISIAQAILRFIVRNFWQTLIREQNQLFKL